MNKMDRQELLRIKTALGQATPGSDEYKALLEQRLKFDQAITREEANAPLIPGVKNETLVVGAIGAAEVGLLAHLQDIKFLPKNLFGMLPIIKLKL